MKRSRFGFVVLALVLSVAAFYTGARFVRTTTAPTHPLTGRPIAGIATNASWLDRSAREQEEKPEQALQFIGIRPGMVVADVGAGTGYMTFRLAQLVGPSGKVIATDLQPEMLQIIRTKAGREHIANVEVVRGIETDARLPEGTIDLALLVDVYHEFRYPQAMLQSIRRSLTPQGELVLIEYRKGRSVGSHRVHPSDECCGGPARGRSGGISLRPRGREPSPPTHHRFRERGAPACFLASDRNRHSRVRTGTSNLEW